jgi:hypothetical protein
VSNEAHKLLSCQMICSKPLNYYIAFDYEI